MPGKVAVKGLPLRSRGRGGRRPQRPLRRAFAATGSSGAGGGPGRSCRRGYAGMHDGEWPGRYGCRVTARRQRSAPVRPRAKAAGELAPHSGQTPLLPRSPTARHPSDCPAHHPPRASASIARARPGPDGLARRRRALEAFGRESCHRSRSRTSVQDVDPGLCAALAHDRRWAWESAAPEHSRGRCFHAHLCPPVSACSYVGMVYCKISVSPGMMEIITRTGLSAAV
jgi:hypothetical protein